MTMYVYTITVVIAPCRSLRLQLLDIVSKPVKSVILLFPVRGKLEVLIQQEEAEFKEKGQVPVDPTMFWIKQTVSPAASSI